MCYVMLYSIFFYIYLYTSGQVVNPSQGAHTILSLIVSMVGKMGHWQCKALHLQNAARNDA